MTHDDTLLGIGGALERVRVEALIEVLRTAWTVTMGKAPGNLEEDLEASRRWFDPVAQGQRLRRELSVLPQFPDTLEDPGPPMSFRVGPRRWLVTPEGRLALEFLESLSKDLDNHAIDYEQLAPYVRRLALLYRRWSRHRLQSVVDLLAGTTKPLQISAAGVVIALLVNRCTSEQRSLTRFSSGSAREVVDRAFFAPVQAFATTLAQSKRRSSADARLVSGWMLYEARRRLGDGLVVIDARGGLNGKVWIQSDAVPDIVDIVTRDLARGHRARPTVERFASAYDALVTELRRQLPTLAGFGLVHERPLETRRLRERLLERMLSHLEMTT
jgi:hypothetical protein